MKLSLVKMFILSKFNFSLALSKTKAVSLRILYISTRNGGLGLRKLTEDKNIVRVNSLLNLLNTNDDKLFTNINTQMKRTIGYTIEVPTIDLINSYSTSSSLTYIPVQTLLRMALKS